MPPDIVIVEELKKYFVTKQGTVRAVDTVSFSVREGETLGLVGESGSGKTTVAHTLVGIYQPTSGRARFRGQDIGVLSGQRPMPLKREIRIVFQDPGSSLNPRWSIKETLNLPLIVHGICSDRAERHERIKKLLEMVENGTVYKREQPIKWKCSICGYVYEGTEPPPKCPCCKYPQEYYEPANLDF